MFQQWLNPSLNLCPKLFFGLLAIHSLCKMILKPFNNTKKPLFHHSDPTGGERHQGMGSSTAETTFMSNKHEESQMFQRRTCCKKPFLCLPTELQDFLALSSTQSVGLQISKFLHSVFGAENKTKHKHPLKSLCSHNTPWQCFPMDWFNFSP